MVISDLGEVGKVMGICQITINLSLTHGDGSSCPKAVSDFI